MRPSELRTVPVPAPLIATRNAMPAGSGPHAGLEASALNVMRTAPSPAGARAGGGSTVGAGIAYRSPKMLSRYDVNVIHAPSGDHEGNQSVAGSSPVSSVWPEPSSFIAHTSQVPQQGSFSWAI